MNMLGLRDLVFIAPTPSSSLHLHQQQGQPISTEQGSNLSVGFGIFPLLTATPCVPQQQQPQGNEVQDCGNGSNSNYWNLEMCPQVNSAKKGVIFGDDDHGSRKNLIEFEENGVNGDGVGDEEFRVCQDCGNRAKKDCIFRRCRTCCKGRGYDCSTHVKSTWVPASRRRERDVEKVVAASGGGGNKRPRALGSSQNIATATTTTSHSSTSNATTTPKSLDISSCHQDAGFKQSLPGHVRARAVFRCHRVSAIANGEDEFAYLATVHISGHVFKGFLYDQGFDGKNAPIPTIVSELQLGNNNSSGKNKECASAIGVATNAYPASAS